MYCMSNKSCPFLNGKDFLEIQQILHWQFYTSQQFWFPFVIHNVGKMCNCVISLENILMLIKDFRERATRRERAREISQDSKKETESL